MLTSFCLGAKIHKQIRLNRPTYTHTHTHLPSPSSPTAIVNAMGRMSQCPSPVFAPVPLISFFCFLLYLLFSLVYSISLCFCHDESGKGSDRHSTVTWLLPEICVSFLPQSFACLPPSYSPLSFSLSHSCLKLLKPITKSRHFNNVGQEDVFALPVFRQMIQVGV